MFGGETVKAKLSFDESLVNVVLDYFGNDIHLIDTNDGRFTINAEVTGSNVFLGWIFQFGDKAKILEPKSLRDDMKKLNSTVDEMYS